VTFFRIIPVVAMVAILSGCGNSTRSASPVDSLDSTPPPAVTGISIITNGRTGEPTLLWEASAAADVNAYHVYMHDGAALALLGSTPTNRMDVPSAASGVIYAVRAVDGSGNFSPYALYTVGEDDLGL
jgi:hypothetical protein